MFVKLALIALSASLLVDNARSAEDKEKRILMDDNYYTLVSRLEALEREVSILKTDYAMVSYQTVAFMAYLTKTISGSHHHIYFDDVKLNLGNAYNPHHGTFVVPVNGTYQFSVTACSYVGHFIVLDLTVNNSNIGKVLAGDKDFSECSSKAFLVNLKAGDDVFVQHVDAGDYLFSTIPYGLPSFSGFLLRAD